MIAKSIKGKTTEEIKSALSESKSDGFKPTLAVVFLSAFQEREAVCSLLDKEHISIFGTTTGGEFIDDEVEQDSIAILLLDINPSYFKIIITDADNNSSKEITNIIGEAGKKTFPNPAFIVALAGRNIDYALFIDGIQNKVEKNIFVFGGIAGNIIDGSATYIFDNNANISNGLNALIIDNDKINITGFATSGWKPIATFHTITKSEGHKVFTIDDEPAMDMIGKYLGRTFDNFLDEEKIYSDEDTPIQLYRDNAPSVLREIAFFNGKTRTINFSGPVPQGSKFRFSLPPDWDIVDKIKSDCVAIKEQQQPEADAVIVFSCSARLRSLGPLVNDEIKEIKNTWGCPVAGFFSFGEIGKYLGGQTEFHNNTCCVVALKEK